MKVVNVADFGGAQKAQELGVVVVMRKWSPLGNPFALVSEDLRDVCIRRYRTWLWHRIQEGDALVLGALRRLKEHDLIGCCCAPKACHADVIVRAARWLREEDAKK